MSAVVRLAMALAALLLVAPAGVQAGSSGEFPAIVVTAPGATGAAAVAALGDQLPEVAAYYGKTVDQLRAELLAGSGLRLGRSGRLHRTSPVAAPSPAARLAASAMALGVPLAGNDPIPLDQTFQLHSNPGARKTIYLNFVGKTLTRASHALIEDLNLEAIAVPPFSIDASADFSDAELRVIQEIWQRVAEDYTPFDVDVTTEPVAQDRITRADDMDEIYGIDVLFARREAAWSCPFCASSGYLRAFFDTDGVDAYKPAVVFHEAGGIGARLLADAATREIGNTLGLFSDGVSGVSDYYAGQGDSPVNGWAPIMGGLSERPLRQFDKGEYSGARGVNSEGQFGPPDDDFKVIMDSGLALRSDDAGATPASASWLPVTSSGGRSSGSHDGVITPAPFSATAVLPPDADVFYIRAGAGPLSMRVDPAAFGPNADLVLTLRDSSGATLQSSNPLGALDAAISYNVPAAGTYYLEVKGTGEGDPAVTGYSNYGSVGAYRISGDFPTASGPLPSASFSFVMASGSASRTVTLDPSASAAAGGNIMRYHWDFGDGSTQETLAPTPLQKTFATAGTYTVTLTVTNDSGLSASTTRQIFFNAPPSAAFDLVTEAGTPLTISVDASKSADDVQITTYRWAFGDGTTQEGSSPGPVRKTFATAGTYTVTLTVTDGSGLTDSTARSVELTGSTPTPVPPTAAFTATKGPAALQVTFNASQSSDSDGSITRYLWDFGDGSSQEASSGAPLQKTYAAPGTYQVTLSVVDNTGLTGSRTETVTVAPAPLQPVAAFTASLSSGNAPLGVEFNAVSSNDPDGQIQNYDWSFGDGTTQSGGSASIVQKTYTIPGRYTVTLTVTDNSGLTAATSRSITVTSPPTASFTASYVPGTAPLTATFNPAASADVDGSIARYLWSFGDGTEQEVTTPAPVQKTYTSPGNYEVKLRVVDDTGLFSAEVSRFVQVVPASAIPVASFTASKPAPLTVLLDPAASVDDVGIALYRWEFDDGTVRETGTAEPVQKTFATPGDHSITLIVTDGDGFTARQTQTVTVDPQPVIPVPPVAFFRGLPASGRAPVSVTLDPANSSDGDGRITQYRWEFGDGSSREVGSAAPQQMTFTQPGEYRVTLRVTDDDGLTGEFARTITVSPALLQPVAAFAASPEAGVAPLSVAFDPASSRDDDGRIELFRWDFGDGTSRESTSATPVQKTFTAPGSYRVTLRVTDNDGLVSEASRSVTVTAASEPQVAVVSVSFAPSGKTKVRGRALVTVLDASGAPTNRATVIARWSGLSNAVSSARTGRFGQAGLTAPSTAAAGCLRVTVVGVRIGKATYVPPPSASGEVCR